MINHIDLSSVLRRTVCDLYSDLVTRPTGAAVRTGIEQQLAEMGDRSLTVIDFSHVGLLDFSCADEIVAKLLLRYCGRAADLPPTDAYFLFRGLNDSHRDAIETVLERHGLAIVAEDEDGVTLVGTLGDGERRAWDAIRRLGRVAAADLSRATGLDEEQVSSVLDELCQRRLVMRFEEGYVAVGGVA
ncbi:MAG TPA: hypothetical protein VJ812_16960 [Gemmatimonadaceae bacterium]|jgi:hypothetical protein|nr:hypothetical protein [Gemmatimonadaceae bacterium]